MKTIILALLGVAFTAGAQAGERKPADRERPVKRQPAASQTNSFAVTGSNITRPVRRIGATYDTPQNIHVIDREHIDQSGATTLAGVLRRYPFVGIR